MKKLSIGAFAVALFFAVSIPLNSKLNPGAAENSAHRDEPFMFPK